MAKGFRDVINGSANGAGIVLPDSQTADYAIDQIGKYGLLQQQNYLRNKQYQAQTNKDFADNALKLPPGLQYQAELNKLAQNWMNKGVAYRRQGFDPFNADYSKPDQASAAQEYLNEMQHIKNLADLQKGVDADFKTKSEQSQQGKLDGFDEYNNTLQGHTLQSLYQAGGINALPSLYKPVDLSDVDNSVTVKPQTVEKSTPGPYGTEIVTTTPTVNVPQLASSWEQAFNNQPGVARHLAKKGISNPRNLYTFMGHNMIRDNNNPEDYGHIDEPGIYHQMVTDYLTDPDMIKQLPDSVKQKIVAGTQGPKSTGSPFNKDTAAGAILQKPYSPVDDPDFQNFVEDKFNKQITQERGYQGEIQNGVMRKLQGLDLGSKEKTDATMANLKLRMQTTQQGWQRLKNETSNADINRKKWQARMGDAGTREKWIVDIQKNNPDAVSSLKSALTEIHGARLVPYAGGFKVGIPEEVPNADANGKISLAQPKKLIMHQYVIDRHGGRGARMQIEQVLNKLPTIGKEKALKTEPYAPDYNDLGGGNTSSSKEEDTADDL